MTGKDQTSRPQAHDRSLEPARPSIRVTAADRWSTWRGGRNKYRHRQPQRGERELAQQAPVTADAQGRHTPLCLLELVSAEELLTDLPP